MSLKRLFGKKDGSFKPESLARYKEIVEDVESISYIEKHIQDRTKFRSSTDFATASNFAAYGSLEEYYESAIDRIQNEFPYDGSLKEKLEYFTDSSGFDLHVFENEYPRTNGHAIFSSHTNGDGWGSVTSTSGAYGNPQTKEYIYMKGGPGLGNVYHTASSRGSNLEINGITGNTVEFWLKKSEYVTSKTQKEVVLDITTTSSLEGSKGYGRLSIEVDGSDSSKSPFILTYQSGSSGFKNVRVGTTHLHASASDDAWHHYAFTFKNQDGAVSVKNYVDGELNKQITTGSAFGSLNTPLIGAIGALVAGKDVNHTIRTAPKDHIPGLGYGKLSGSLDEFRFWKTKRNSKQVGRFWFTQVGAGANTDLANSQLGVYYKFNEGITELNKIDKTVLDYSGRVTNGDWVGYRRSARSVGSAMVQSSASVSEFKDPILYDLHPSVKSFRSDALEEGRAYDLTNHSSLYYSIPDYIVQEDGEGGGNTLKKIVQIVASYFDSLNLQIKDLSKLKHLGFDQVDGKPHPFNDIKLESLGLVAPELFLDADALNIFHSRDEDQEFEKKIHDTKNYIYNNIYNNLESIYKSKGSLKSFRNLFRCFGIDNELIRINTYSTDSRYPIDNSYVNRTAKNKYVNFAKQKNTAAVVIQSINGMTTPRTNDARGYITGSADIFPNPVDLASSGFTVQSQVFFPVRHPIQHPFHVVSSLSSSIMGCHAVRKNNDQLLTWTSETDDDSNFQVFAVRSDQDTKNAKFVLSCRNNLFEPVESGLYYDLYDGNKWNLAVSLRQENLTDGPVSGSDGHYNMVFQGVRTVADSVAEEFLITSSISAANAQKMISSSRRFFIGSHRTDFIGPINQTSDVKISNFRYWQKSLHPEEVRAHARDPNSYGLLNPSRQFAPLLDIGNVQVPEIDLLTINWDFSNLTGSNANGQMWVTDVSSGSFDEKQRLGLLEPIVGRIHPGKAHYFEVSTTSSVSVEHDHSSKLHEFENIQAPDTVKISLNDDIVFTRESKPTDLFFSFEKSMYGAITDEMLNFFAGINEFSNLIGAPVEKYRQTYKELDKLRQIFFRRIENNPDIERFTEYYKWIDSSLSIMIDQFKPASISSSEDIRNMIESHVFERNKYQTKYPTLEMKAVEPVGQIKAINELLYDWEHGHAPLDRDGNTNCLWEKDRAQRSSDSKVDSSIDSDREIIRRSSNTDVSGSTYVIRKLTRPYKLSVTDQRHAKGGDNTFGNKKKRFFSGVARPFSKDYIAVTGSDASVKPLCSDIINPSKKKKMRATADISAQNRDFDVNDVAPFTLYTSSIASPTDYKSLLYTHFKQNVDITNIHSDEYGDDREVAMQSPFTERHVGGNMHRHQDLSGSLRANFHKSSHKHGTDRREAFNILAESGKLYVLPPNSTGLNDSDLPAIDKDIQSMQLLRFPLAKRPVNIRNIATTTSSIALGNFNHIYDVVQYTSEVQRKDLLIDNIVQLTSSVSTAIPGIAEFVKIPRPVRKSVFKSRFSPIGGTEVAGNSRGGHSIDRETNQFSIYTTLNYRNLSVRGPRNFLDSIPQTASMDVGTQLVTDHKINRNPRYSRKQSGATYTDEMDLNFDNRFVTHEIPQNDIQYSWITASILPSDGIDVSPGHLHSFTQASLGAKTGSLSYEKTYEFLSASVHQREIGQTRREYTSTQELNSGVDDGGQLGTSVHLYKNIVIAGAPTHTSNKGAALIFERQDGLSTTYGSPVTLAPADLSAGDNFGRSVAVSGNYAVVGAPGQDSDKGAAYFFEKQGVSWTQIQKITAPADTAGDDYGTSVYMDPHSDFVIVGANGEDSSKGSVYIYRNDKTALTQIQRIQASDGSANDNFSGPTHPAGITIRNNLLVAGASQNDTGGSNRGAVYVFSYDGTQWNQAQKLIASDAANSDQFGYSVAATSDHKYIFVGTAASESVYVFENQDGTWTQTQILVASDAGAGDLFGEAVECTNRYLIVSARAEDPGSVNNAGSAYIYEKINGTWTQIRKISKGEADAFFGTDVGASSVRFDLDRKDSVSYQFAVGSRTADPGSRASAGTVDIFDFEKYKKRVIDFVGINRHVVDTINTTNSTVTAEVFDDLNQLTLHRQGPFGYPTWKQVRAGQTAVGRYLSLNNIYAIPVSEGDRNTFIPSLGPSTNGYAWPSNIETRIGTKDITVDHSTYRFVQASVSSNRLPLQLFIRGEKQGGSGPTRQAPQFLPVEQVTYNNKLSTFPTEKLSDALHKLPSRQSQTQLLHDSLNPRAIQQVLVEEGGVYKFDNTGFGGTFDDIEAFTEKDQIRYRIEMYPKEEHTYLERTRERVRFDSDFWRTRRDQRTLTNITNSQGQTVSRLSMWPLDAQTNFTKTAVERTTDDNTNGGSGELLSTYSIFHNNLNYPSASALLSRPFPIQGTSSLPQNITMYHMSLTASWSADMQQYESDYSIASRTTDYTPHGGFTPADCQNTTSKLFQSAGGFLKDTVNNKGEKFGDSIGATTSGPRVHRGANSSKARSLLFFGTGSEASAVPGAPGSYSAYRFVRFINTIKTPAFLTFHLKTGNSTTVEDSLGLHKATTPFYVQVSGSTASGVGHTNGWENVFKTNDISEYATSDTFKKVSVLITSSLSNASIRLVSALTSSGYHNNTEGQWAVKFLNLYSAPLKDRELSPYFINNKSHAVAIDRITSTGSSDNQFLYSETITEGGDIQREYFSPQTNYAPVLTFASLDKFKDHVDAANGGYQNDNINPDDDLHNFNFQLMQTGSKKHLIYAKNRKNDEYLLNSQNFFAGADLGRNPFNYDSYEDFIYQSRLLAKDYGVVPEFRISEHMDFYINSVGGTDPFFRCNETLLTLTGATAPANSSDQEFYNIYSHSDFIKHFDVVDKYMSDSGGELTTLTLKCKAFKKFLPYRGFYPADRVTQMAQIFSSSYNQYVTGGHWRNALAPYYAPGIALNTIKSGIAVDYPVFEPHKDRPYNNYGVIFQSASLSSGTPVLPPSDGNHHIPNVDGNISKNRIEIGGGSSWGKTISGSLSSGGDKFGVSFWVYLPSSNAIIASALPHAGSPALKLALTPNLGTIMSLGSGENETTTAWRTGLHIALSTGATGVGTEVYGAAGGTPNVNNDFKVFLIGGNGTDYFIHSGSKPTPTPTITAGWNHLYLETDINNPTLANTSFYFNGTLGNKGTDTNNTSVSSYSNQTIKLDGSRNSFIGSHLGGVKRINTDITDNSKTLTPLPTSFSSYIAGSSATLAPQDLLKPLEIMMSEIVVVNKSLTATEIKKLSGFQEVSPPKNIPYTTPNYKLGKAQGPSSPYTSIGKSKHDNIVAWYKPGNDVGYTSKTSHSTNLKPVFNHAQDFRSGVVYNHDSGSIHRFTGGNTDLIRDLPITLNHLSGTFYGFNSWTGSVAADLEYSPRFRQRWNGIADLTNPSQYSLTYHIPRGYKSADSSVSFKTWYANFGSNRFTDFENIANEKSLFLAPGADTFSGSVTMITGSTAIPSYIVGSKFNFTDDSSIPRIGSASFGTNHFVGRGNHREDPVYSQGWITDYQSSTGVKNVFRVPFEAIIVPESFTPKMKDNKTKNTALFYDIEPHPSASLHPAFVRKFKHKSDPSNLNEKDGVETTDDFYNANFYNDENYALGVPRNSERLKSEFDLAAAQTGKKSLYTYAAENFYTECERFFLDAPDLKIASEFVPGTVDYDKTYKSSITLKTGGTNRSNTNFMYSNPAAFGPPVDAGKTRGPTSSDLQFLPRALESNAYGFSPYLPPHYDGESIVQYKFVPDPDRVYDNIESVLLDTKVEFIRHISATGSAGYKRSFCSNENSGYDDARSSYNRKYAMHLSASFRNMAPRDASAFVQVLNNDLEPMPNLKSWVIQPKFICPNFDFNKKTRQNTSAPLTQETIQHLPKITGIWHQGAQEFKDQTFATLTIDPFGQIDRGLSDEEVLAAFDSESSFSQLIGLSIKNGGQTASETMAEIGRLRDGRRVREAVVAIPFRIVNGVKKFFDLPEQEVYQSMREVGFPNYKLESIVEQQESQTESGGSLDILIPNINPFGQITNQNQGLEEVRDIRRVSTRVRGSIKQMVSAMTRYNIPPQFNFLKFNDRNGKFIHPFAMYLFEFEHLFTKDDLSRIWQNTTPDVGLDTYSENGLKGPISSAYVSHELFGLNDLLSPQPQLSSITNVSNNLPDSALDPPSAPGPSRFRIEGWSGGLTPDVRWMVFKVKQKGKVDYFKAKERSKLGIMPGHPDLRVTYDELSQYGYNWPYDYFSLIELVNIEAQLDYRRSDSLESQERNEISAEEANRFLEGE